MDESSDLNSKNQDSIQSVHNGGQILSSVIIKTEKSDLEQTTENNLNHCETVTFTIIKPDVLIKTEENHGEALIDTDDFDSSRNSILKRLLINEIPSTVEGGFDPLDVCSTEIDPILTSEETMIGKKVRKKKAKESSEPKQKVKKKHPCDQCGKLFNKRHDLLRHIHIHSGIKPYVCEFCQKSFAEKQKLKTHQFIHTGEKPYECHLCQRKFNAKSALIRHGSIHSDEKPFSCQECNQRFKRKDALVKHKRIHTGLRLYECNYCGKAFTQGSNLLTHKRIHTGEKKFACEICPIAFISNSDLVRHKRTHSGERPYICDICNANFAQNSALNKHKRIHKR